MIESEQSMLVKLGPVAAAAGAQLAGHSCGQQPECDAHLGPDGGLQQGSLPNRPRGLQ